MPWRRRRRSLPQIQGVTGDTVTEDHLGQIASATTSLVGSLGGGTSAFGVAVEHGRADARQLAIPGFGPLAGVATLIALGVRLGSAEFERWRARVLAAPT